MALDAGCNRTNLLVKVSRKVSTFQEIFNYSDSSEVKFRTALIKTGTSFRWNEKRYSISWSPFVSKLVFKRVDSLRLDAVGWFSGQARPDLC